MSLVIQQLLEELTHKNFLGTKVEAIVKWTVFEDAPKMHRTQHIVIENYHFSVTSPTRQSTSSGLKLVPSK
jgi:hypothetical protein